MLAYLALEVLRRLVDALARLLLGDVDAFERLSRGLVVALLQILLHAGPRSPDLFIDFLGLLLGREREGVVVGKRRVPQHRLAVVLALHVELDRRPVDLALDRKSVV